MKIPSARDTLTSCLKFCFRYLPHLFSKPPARMHEEWDDLAVGDLDRMNLQAHRDGAKSTFWAIGYPLWRTSLFQWLCNHGQPEQEENGIILGVDADSAIDRLRQVKREIETNKLLIADYGPFTPGEDWTEEKFTLACAKDVKNATLTATGLISLEPGGRYTYAVLDDTTHPKHVYERVQRDKQERQLTEVLEPSMREGGPIIAIHTTYHNNDLPNRLTKDTGWFSKKWPLVIDKDAKTVQWPAHWSWERVEKAMKKPLVFARQMQLKEAADEDRLIPAPTRYDPRVIEYRDGAWRVKGEVCHVVMAGDPALTATDLNKGSRTAIVVALVTPRLEKYVVYAVGGRWGVDKSVKQAEDAWRMWNAHVMWLEEVLAFKIMGNLLRAKGVPCIGVPAEGEKISRISGTLNPDMTNGKLLFPEALPAEVGGTASLVGGPEMADCIAELEEFVGDTVDFADALAILVAQVQKSPVYAAAARTNKLIRNVRGAAQGRGWLRSSYED